MWNSELLIVFRHCPKHIKPIWVSYTAVYTLGGGGKELFLTKVFFRLKCIQQCGHVACYVSVPLIFSKSSSG